MNILITINLYLEHFDNVLTKIECWNSLFFIKQNFLFDSIAQILHERNMNTSSEYLLRWRSEHIADNLDLSRNWSAREELTTQDHFWIIHLKNSYNKSMFFWQSSKNIYQQKCIPQPTCPLLLSARAWQRGALVLWIFKFTLLLLWW